ncbi:hypothetical protein HK099_002188 [Clydaea vesicula]|uniref:C2H2-type domain-containing protein n=1 Tax=Clydaea vesicula TaxID=447962 RepID=A0AAD5U2Y0_9FUNG|nr:hypothetical protein HK099_002188 [Clydaea vesicula]KAJ3388538.1 hypothetical protein HDU92_001430 [Lobulomyces angularis]
MNGNNKIEKTVEEYEQNFKDLFSIHDLVREFLFKNGYNLSLNCFLNECQTIFENKDISNKKINDINQRELAEDFGIIELIDDSNFEENNILGVIENDHSLSSKSLLDILAKHLLKNKRLKNYSSIDNILFSDNIIDSLELSFTNTEEEKQLVEVVKINELLEENTNLEIQIEQQQFQLLDQKRHENLKDNSILKQNYNELNNHLNNFKNINIINNINSINDINNISSINICNNFNLNSNQVLKEKTSIYHKQVQQHQLQLNQHQYRYQHQTHHQQKQQESIIHFQPLYQKNTHQPNLQQPQQNMRLQHSTSLQPKISPQLMIQPKGRTQLQNKITLQQQEVKELLPQTLMQNLNPEMLSISPNLSSLSSEELELGGEEDVMDLKETSENKNTETSIQISNSYQQNLNNHNSILEKEFLSTKNLIAPAAESHGSSLMGSNSLSNGTINTMENSALNFQDNIQHCEMACNDGNINFNNLEKVYRCPLPTCNKFYSTAAGLRYHTKTIHATTPKKVKLNGEEPKPFKYRCCGKSYTTLAGYRYHTKTAHSEYQEAY